MKKWYGIIILFVLLFSANTKLSANYYLGLGGNYMLPSGEFSEINKAALGLNVQLESRAYCNWWFGMRIDYYQLDPVDDIAITQDYYENMLIFSPGFRYNFLGSDCKEYNFIPYGQIQIPFSSIGNTDETSRFGIGAIAGAGIAYSFQVFDLCWMIDLNARYVAPNIIYKDEARESLRYLDLSLTLSLRL